MKKLFDHNVSMKRVKGSDIISEYGQSNIFFLTEDDDIVSYELNPDSIYEYFPEQKSTVFEEFYNIDTAMENAEDEVAIVTAKIRDWFTDAKEFPVITEEDFDETGWLTKRLPDIDDINCYSISIEKDLDKYSVGYYFTSGMTDANGENVEWEDNEWKDFDSLDEVNEYLQKLFKDYYDPQAAIEEKESEELPEEIEIKSVEEFPVEDSWVKDMALSRSDAIDRCISLGKPFIEHFDKIYKDSENEAVDHWIKEMNAWFNKVKSIKLKETNGPILSGNLRDWFFTAGANPEDFMDSPTNEELEAYDMFTIKLINGEPISKEIIK